MTKKRRRRAKTKRYLKLRRRRDQKKENTRVKNLIKIANLRITKSPREEDKRGTGVSTR